MSFLTVHYKEYREFIQIFNEWNGEMEYNYCLMIMQKPPTPIQLKL